MGSNMPVLRGVCTEGVRLKQGRGETVGVNLCWLGGCGCSGEICAVVVIGGGVCTGRIE